MTSAQPEQPDTLADARHGSFTLHGTVYGQPAWLMWTNGQLSGSPPALALVRALARVFEGEPVGGGLVPPTERDHLSVGVSAYRLMVSAFDGAVRVDGIIPGMGEDEVIIA